MECKYSAFSSDYLIAIVAKQSHKIAMAIL